MLVLAWVGRCGCHKRRGVVVAFLFLLQAARNVDVCVFLEPLYVRCPWSVFWQIAVFSVSAVVIVCAWGAAAQILPPIIPTTCYTNADCDFRSYCDVGNGTGPWACHPISVPLCANHSQVCLHNGFTVAVGCEKDSDCKPGSFCKNTLERSPPYICEGDDAPICSCSCAGDWSGTYAALCSAIALLCSL